MAENNADVFDMSGLNPQAGMPETSDPEVIQESEFAEELVETPEEEHFVQKEPSEMSDEDKARALNWTPKEEWKGDPSKWVDARTFLKRTEPILPMLKKDRDRLIQKVDKLERELQNTRAAWQTHHEQDRGRIIQAYEDKISELKSLQKVAVEEGDLEKYEKIEQQREEVEKKRTEHVIAAEREEPQKKQPVQLPQELIDWGNENPWFGKDGRKTKIMQHVAEVVLFDNPTIDKMSREFYDITLESAKRAYPEAFGAKRKATTASDSSSGILSTTSREYTGRVKEATNGKTFADLPPEAKKMAMEMKSHGMPIEQYVAEYFKIPGKQRVQFHERPQSASK